MRHKYAGKQALFIGIALFCSFYAFSLAYALDEQITDKYVSALPSPQQEAKEQAFAPRPGGKMKVTGFVDIQQGYDNNVDLDSNRFKDGFLQTTANIDTAYSFTETFKFRGGADYFQTIYYKHNKNNLSDVSPYIGFDYEFMPGVVSRNRFIFDYFSYPNEKENTFTGIVLSSYIRQYFCDYIFHEAGYEYLRRWYPDRATFDDNGFYGLFDRADERYRMKYNLGFIFPRAFFTLSNEFQINDSNDKYQEYYDYSLYRLKPSVIFFLRDDLYTDIGLLYKYTAYKDRRSTENSDKKERDNTFLFNVSVYYEFMKNVTLGITYSYSENISNDPFQKYSGSILSGGLYYSF
ncbi:MAG: hypothetical protein ABH883_07035 [Candidatus Omnitrophota bacterium]